MGKLKRLFILFKEGIHRHIVNFFICVAALLTFIFFIYTEFDPEILILRTFMSFAFSYMSALCHTIIARRLKKTPSVVKISITAVISFVLCMIVLYLLSKPYDNNYYYLSDYAVMGYIGLIFSMLCLCVYFSSMQKSELSFGIHFVHLIKNGVFSMIMASVMMAGLSICLLAFTALIFEFDDTYKIYETLAFFSYVVLFPALFTATLPQSSKDYRESKPAKILSLYIATPIYLLLMAILYIYFIKILVTLSFPSGLINWFASFATLSGFILWFFMQEHKSNYPYVNLFTKWLGAMLLPVIAVQIIAVFIRLAAYGLTTLRYISLICIIIAVSGCVTLLIKNGRYFHKIILAMAIIALISTIGPINALDIPIKSQQSRLKNVLLRNDMLENDKVIAKTAKDLSEDDRNIIIGAYNYLAINGDDSLKFIGIDSKNAQTNNDFRKVFGFEKTYYTIKQDFSSRQFVFNAPWSHDYETDISAYSTLILDYSGVYTKDVSLKDYDYTVTLDIGENNKFYKFSLKNLLPDLNTLEDNSYYNGYFTYPDGALISLDGQAKLFINELRITLEYDNIKRINVSGNLLIR